MNRFLMLTRLFLRSQLTTGRMFLVASFGVLLLAVALAVGSGPSPAALEDVVDGLGGGLGFGLGIPILALVFASATLGDLVEDETLVYLWHRPSPRWYIALAAWAASTLVTAPAIGVAMVVAGAIASSGDWSVAFALGFAGALASMAYCGAFTLLGVLLKRSLIWGLLYVFIWESLLTRVFAGLKHTSIRSYSSAVAGHISKYEVFAAEHASWTATGALFFIAAGSVAATSYRLNHMDVA